MRAQIISAILSLPQAPSPSYSLPLLPQGARVTSVKETEAVMTVSCTHGLRWLKERTVTFSF